jgi:hypothetical protein
MSNTRVIETPPNPSGVFYSYPVKFLLSETTGTSGATITGVRVSTSREAEETGPSCWRTPIRVAPGGTLDVFDTGWVSLSYCAPSVLPFSTLPVSVLVTYQDDEGRLGSVTATAVYTK